MNRNDQIEFSVDDEVRIVDKPNHKCAFSWAKSMDQYCGRLARIIEKHWNEQYHIFLYRINIDHREWAWDAACFVPTGDDLDFDITDDEFLSLLLM